MKGILLDDSNDLKIDIRRDENGLITGGLCIGEITAQNQKILLLAQKGEIKDVPLIGVGVSNYLDDEDPNNLLRAIRTEFAKEGMPVKKVSITNGKIEVDAEYNS